MFPENPKEGQPGSPRTSGPGPAPNTQVPQRLSLRAGDSRIIPIMARPESTASERIRFKTSVRRREPSSESRMREAGRGWEAGKNQLVPMCRRKHPSTSGGTRGVLSGNRGVDYSSGRGQFGTFEGRWRKLPKMPEAVGTDPSTSRKMAELEEVTLDGKPLQALRVTDLKAALEQRGLAKSGQKSALVKRLKGVRRRRCRGVRGKRTR